MFLDACHDEVGFKKGHRRDMCIYVVKEMIEYFKSLNTSVFVTFLDASKAYDKIDHWQLFKVIEKCTNFYFGTEKLPPKF